MVAWPRVQRMVNISVSAWLRGGNWLFVIIVLLLQVYNIVHL